MRRTDSLEKTLMLGGIGGRNKDQIYELTNKVRIEAGYSNCKRFVEMVNRL